MPALFLDAGQKTAWRVIEFLTANIRNPNTREAYGRAIVRFARWAEQHKLQLTQLQPFFIATYIEDLGKVVSAPTVKQHLAALKMLFDYLVIGQVLPMNPASGVRGPKHVVTKGSTPILTAKEARLLINSIDVHTITGLRDRALIGTMLYSFARVSATLGMNMEDYSPRGKRMWLRLREKGGRLHHVPVHHKAEQYLDEYLAGGALAPKGTPLFRTVNRQHQLTERRMTRREALAVVKRRARAAGLPYQSVCNHSFRATAITLFLRAGGTLEDAQAIAAHSSPRTTKLYDRTNEEVSLDEIERIVL
jgi:site-specific recombinase XerD